MTMASMIGAGVRFRGALWTPELREFASSSMRSALGRFERRISEVIVTLEDLNGPRGGVDKRCRVAVRLRRGRGIVVHATAANEHAAISEACSRMRHRLVRSVTRRRYRRRIGDAGMSMIA